MTRQLRPCSLSGPKRDLGLPVVGGRNHVCAFRVLLSLVLFGLMTFTGCHPSQPFYFHEDGDLSHYLDRATQLESPDLYQPHLAEVDQAIAPYRISRPEELEPWD